MCLYGSPCFNSVLDSLNYFFYGLWNLSRVEIMGSFVSFFFFLLPFSSSYLIKSSRSFMSLLLWLWFWWLTLKILFSIASILLVCRNFSLVCLKRSIFLSSFDVSSLLPVGFYSKTTYLMGACISGSLTPLKYSCFNILR